MRALAAILLRWVTTEAVVDQIDAGVAAVELRNRSVIYVAIDALPSGVREGDRVRVHAGRPVVKPRLIAGQDRRGSEHDP